MFLILTTSFIYLHLAAAQSQNATSNNTTPNASSDRIGWKSSPDGRSTKDIIWSCASVLLVCTYKCLHLNISRFEENRAGWRRTKRWGIPYWPEWLMIWKWLRKIKWMGVILLAPEIGVAVACSQYVEAREEVRKAEAAFPEESLTLTHGFYAVAGGFAARVKREVPMRNLQENARFIDEDGWELRRLNLATYVKLCKTNEDRPIVTEHDINDRSKSDFFTKTFAIVQSTWLVLQSIARVSVGLPISELELATIAYVLCALIIYGFWWYKPFDVEHVTVLQSTGPVAAKPWEKRNEFKFVDSMKILIVVNDEHEMGAKTFVDKRSIMVYIVAAIFSVIHLAAWNWDFPTPLSRTFWRVFGVSSTASGPVILFLTSLYLALDFAPSRDKVFNWLAILGGLAMVSYIISRIGLMVLIFYAFASLPVAVYETVEWTAYLPHFS
ncbi:hypothetical protein DL98DRAFT_651161 [Cadophora sp. DSE1049]|nr:hypothetical protein DL98DRAFT_651161 [Cadophora sp. DSE1049]